MISEEPKVARTGKYQTMQAARLMGCDRRTLAKYADYFRVVPHLNKVNNRPYYTGEQLLRIWRATF